MSNDSQSGNSILDQAVKEWGQAQVLFESPAWKGKPVARHLVDLLKDRPDLEVDLIALLNHNNQLVVAYSLLTLDKMNSPALGKLPPELFQRGDKITQMMGSFADKLELKAFARHIQKKWLARNIDK
jgi:hypothetical protein